MSYTPWEGAIMKKSTILFVWGFLVLAAPVSFAADAKVAAVDANADAYYQVSEVKFTEVVPTAEEIAAGYLLPNNPSADLLEDIAGLDWNTMVLLGQKFIELVKAGAPVLNVKRDAVAVVPQGVQAWQQLGGWQMPVTKVYQMSVVNGFGSNVVDVRVKVSAMWGGNVAGRGQYLANVLVVPANLQVMWGWSLDMWSENSDPVNTGSFEAPNAGLGFEVRYTAKSPLTEITGSQDYFVTGAGQIAIP